MRKRGFSLVELMIVVAIFLVLAGILLPVITSTRAKAKRNNCLSNLKQISTGMLMYANESDESFPRHNVAGSTNYPDLCDLSSARAMDSIGLAGESEVWQCPSSKGGPFGINNDQVRLFGMDGAVGQANYAMMTNWKGTPAYDGARPSGLSPRTPGDLVGPLVGDCINDWTGDKNVGGAGAEINGPHEGKPDINGGNQIFSDGHGSWFTRDTIMIGGPAWESANNKYYWVERE